MFITPRLSVLGFGSLTSIHFADQAIRSCSWRYFFAHGKTRSAVIVVLFSATPVCYKVLNLGDVTTFSATFCQATTMHAHKQLFFSVLA